VSRAYRIPPAAAIFVGYQSGAPEGLAKAPALLGRNWASDGSTVILFSYTEGIQAYDAATGNLGAKLAPIPPAAPPRCDPIGAIRSAAA